MPQVTRRKLMLGAAAGSLAPAVARGAKPADTRKSGIKLALMLSERQASRITLAKQIGVTHAIIGTTGALMRAPRSEYTAAIAKLKAAYADLGITVAGVESHPVPAEKIKLGVEGRDEELENYAAAIKALAENGIDMVCYNFMAGLGWYRTRTDLPERGGALTTEFDAAAANARGLTRWGEIPEEKVWANMEYFQKAIIPVAGKAGVKMALHPDDPALSPLRGIGRILTSAANYRRVMNIVPSPVNGVTFCQANFRAMGENIYELAREWCQQKKIFFVHFRDIQGDRNHFHETFHDNGPTDMARMLKIYHENGFDGPIRPDHAPILANEDNSHPGYGMQGKIFAIGYMMGLMQGQKIPYV